MTRLYDTHCHIDFNAFDDDREQVLRRAAECGVERLMVPGVTATQWPQLIALAERYDNWRFGLGLHPWFIQQHERQHVVQLEQRLSQPAPGLKAVGEIGLDATCDSADVQKWLFVEQLKLAREYRLPVIVHHRKTLETMHPLIKQHGPESGVIHAFSGSYEQAMKFIDCGYKIGVGGVITYARAKKTRAAITRVPLSALVLETDSPDMPLSGHQGHRNEPARVKEVLTVLSELRGLSTESLGEVLWRNSCELFNETQCANSDRGSD